MISLDFELHWGVRDKVGPDSPYVKSLLGARDAIPALLALFREYEVAATWATVGFLFARSRQELEEYSPRLRPKYSNPAHDPFQEMVGNDEQDDPLHYASSLINSILSTPRQEVATHTFSHYYCLAEGHSLEAFDADLKSAQAIAKQYGIYCKSIVFPRNQHVRECEHLLLANGITAFRGCPENWMWATKTSYTHRLLQRAGRLADAYVRISQGGCTPWHSLLQGNGLCNIRATQPLRPYSPRLRHFDTLRLRRIRRDLHHAAVSRKIYHLWWHPHNFGQHLQENVKFLRAVLEIYREYHEEHGMNSLSMAEVALEAQKF